MKKFIIPAAIALSFVAATVSLPANAAHHSAHKIKCSGINSCKGKSQCKTAKNSCKGMNSCKGQGWVKASQKMCDKKGGTEVTK